jgi:hypothetical protein
MMVLSEVLRIIADSNGSTISINFARIDIEGRTMKTKNGTFE